jgi:hypothetical protein
MSEKRQSKSILIALPPKSNYITFMLKYIKKILAFLSIVLLYFIIKEFLGLYISLRSIHPVLAYVFVTVSAAALVYFAGIPLYRIMKIPKAPAPLKSEANLEKELSKRFDRLAENPYLKSIGYDLSSQPHTSDGYQQVMKVLRKESGQIRSKYVNRLFYSSAISQNGFIDAILILSSSVSLVKETFVLYNGRVSNRDLWTIGKQVYYSMAIGGSETVEYATGEIFSKLSTEGMRSVPFLDKILGSLADGFVNACLLTRVALITDSYCSTLVIGSEKDLRPSPAFIVSTATNITGGVQRRLFDEMKKLAGSRIKNAAMWAANPVKELFKTVKGGKGEEEVLY